MANPLLTVLLPFCLSPIVAFLYRIVTATIAPDLIAAFGLGPAALGLLGSVYFAGFAAMQLPLGILLDRYPPQRVAAGLLLVGASGGVIFALGESVPALLAGRALMGIGMASSVMAGLKAANLWWPRDRLPLFNGLLFGMAGIGGMLATLPLTALLQVLSWREAVLGMGAVAVAVAAIIGLVVPNKPGVAATPVTLRSQVAGLGEIFRSGQFWRHTLLAMTTIGTFSSYQSLWATIWMRDVVQVDRAGQALALFLLLGGLMVGNFGFGALTQLARRRGIDPLVLVYGGLALFVGVELALALQVGALAYPLWAAFGILSGVPVVLYALLAQLFPVAVSGRVNTAMNLMVFASGFLLQWGIGIVIGQFPVAADGSYDLAGHRLAFLLAIGLQGAAIAWFVATSPNRSPNRRRKARHEPELEAGRPQPLP